VAVEIGGLDRTTSAGGTDAHRIGPVDAATSRIDRNADRLALPTDDVF
jgi:hypothetical protein